MSTKSKNIVGVLFAAGVGSRLRPITDTLPKPLVKIVGQTLLERNMHQISKYVDRFVIVVHYLKEQIIEAIGDEFEGKKVVFVGQSSPKGGTLDALRVAIYKGKISPQENIWVMNSDDIHGSDIFQKFAELITRDPDKALIGAKQTDDRERLKQVGVIKKTSDGEFVKIIEKPQEFISDLVNVGIYYFPTKIKKYISKEAEFTDEKEEFITDLLNDYHKDNPIGVVPSQGMWIPISTPQDIESAEQVLSS
jgi:NDP-sugar pyrophosphorylase family protein